MYPTYPPTRATFNPKIPGGLVQMPSPPLPFRTPPSPLRALVSRLNSTPTQRQKAATTTVIKTEPETETRSRITTTSNSLSSSNHAPSLSTQRSLLTSNANINNTTPNSSAFPVSFNTSNNNNNNNNNNQPTLSQALANFFQSQLTTPSSPNNSNTTHPPILDFENSRIEIHFHVHPILRPAFPTPVSVPQKLKRKRGGGRYQRGRGDGITEKQEETGVTRVGDECDLDLDLDVSEERRSKKKVKLSHEFDTLGGYPVERRGTRAGAGDASGVGAKTRSRASGSRGSSTRNRR